MHNKTKAAPTAAKTTATSLYVFSARKPGLWSYDINGTNPPTLIGSAPDAFNFCAITTVGTTLYLLNQGITEQSNTGLWTLEAGADTVMPVQSATPPGVSFNGITAVGNTVYLTRYDAELVPTIYSYEIEACRAQR